MNSEPEATRLRIVCDTNVLVSALAFGGPPEAILQLAARRIIQLVLSPFILEETRRTLESKLAWTQARTTHALTALRELAEIVEPKERLSVISSPDADNRVLEAAVAAKVAYLVTGDTRHLQPLGTIRSIPIVSPSSFLALLLEAPPPAT